MQINTDVTVVFQLPQEQESADCFREKHPEWDLFIKDHRVVAYAKTTITEFPLNKSNYVLLGEEREDD